MTVISYGVSNDQQYVCSPARADQGGRGHSPVINRMHKNAPFRDKNSKKILGMGHMAHG